MAVREWHGATTTCSPTPMTHDRTPTEALSRRTRLNRVADGDVHRRRACPQCRRTDSGTSTPRGCSAPAAGPIKAVQDRLGHEDAQTTLNVYAHAIDSSSERARLAAMYQEATG
jgi:integrase